MNQSLSLLTGLQWLATNISCIVRKAVIIAASLALALCILASASDIFQSMADFSTASNGFKNGFDLLVVAACLSVSRIVVRIAREIFRDLNRHRDAQLRQISPA